MVGGFDSTVRLRSLERFDAKQNTWEMINTTVPHPGTNFLILQIDPQRLIVGGGYSKDTEIYYTKCYYLDVESHELSEAPDLPTEHLI